MSRNRYYSSTYSRSKGVTLLLTLLVLILSATVLARQMSQVTSARMTSSAHTFSIESQWIAESVARQWISLQNQLSIDDLQKPASWTMEQSDRAPLLIEVWPSFAENKVYVPAFSMEAIHSFWSRHANRVVFAADMDKRILESGNSALEVILDPSTLSAQSAYLVPENRRGTDVAPADILTVWGAGRIDINRCSLEVLEECLPGFTSSQLSGILRLRSNGSIAKMAGLGGELSLSEGQQQLLTRVATLQPSTLELVIRIRCGGLSSLYHAVIGMGRKGRLLEIRPII